MNLGSDVVITITGIVLVFAILVLLMLIIMLEGKIFDGMAAKKKAAKEPAAPKAAAKPAAPVQQTAPAPVVEEGIPGDVVAAIMAAIHAMGNGKYTLRAVRRGTNGWCQRHHRTFLTQEEKHDTVYRYSGRYFPEFRLCTVR